MVTSVLLDSGKCTHRTMLKCCGALLTGMHGNLCSISHVTHSLQHSTPPAVANLGTNACYVTAPNLVGRLEQLYIEVQAIW
jgi:hypothetical protein